MSYFSSSSGRSVAANGLPTGGTTSQVLKKNSSTDYDTSWVTPGNLQIVESRNTTAPNATIPVHILTATGTETDIDISIIPKGVGAIIAAIPDNGTTGGNKRGSQAVDLQMSRSANTQVASGNNSFAAGLRNTASNAQSIALGSSNVSSGNTSVTLGLSNNSTGTASVCIGNGNAASNNGAVAIGASNSAMGVGSVAIGVSALTGAISGRQTGSSGNLGVAGDSQFSTWDLKTSTTNATPTVLTMSGAAASATTRVLLPNQTAFAFKAILVGKQQGSTNCAAWELRGLIVRGANAASTVIVGTPTITAIDNTIGWTAPTATADTTNGCLSITVTGVAATNIRWDCTLTTTEITYT